MISTKLGTMSQRLAEDIMNTRFNRLCITCAIVCVKKKRFHFKAALSSYRGRTCPRQVLLFKNGRLTIYELKIDNSLRLFHDFRTTSFIIVFISLKILICGLAHSVINNVCQRSFT